MALMQVLAAVGVFLLSVTGAALGQKTPSLPADPDTTCNSNELSNLVVTASECIDPLLKGKGTTSCCKMLDDVFGVDADAPTANCLCVADVWRKAETAAAGFGAELAGLLDDCNANFATKTGYYSVDDGVCLNPNERATLIANGDLQAAKVVIASQESFWSWVNDEPILFWPLVLSIPAAIGSVGFIWTLLASSF